MTTTLIEVLERSVKKNGPDKPLTIGHLLNLLKMAKREEERKQEERDQMLDMVYAEMQVDECGDRS